MFANFTCFYSSLASAAGLAGSLFSIPTLAPQRQTVAVSYLCIRICKGESSLSRSDECSAVTRNPVVLKLRRSIVIDMYHHMLSVLNWNNTFLVGGEIFRSEDERICSPTNIHKQSQYHYASFIARRDM